jgi:hypothetical protein
LCNQGPNSGRQLVREELRRASDYRGSGPTDVRQHTVSVYQERRRQAKQRKCHRSRGFLGLFKLAFVEDPWGTRIEVVQDPEQLGLHHVHMRGPNPDEVFTWLLAKFGGQRTKLKGKIDAIKYSAAGFSDMWILVQKGDAEPGEGHAIDLIG